MGIQALYKISVWGLQQQGKSERGHVGAQGHTRCSSRVNSGEGFSLWDNKAGLAGGALGVG